MVGDTVRSEYRVQCCRVRSVVGTTMLGIYGDRVVMIFRAGERAKPKAVKESPVWRN